MEWYQEAFAARVKRYREHQSYFYTHPASAFIEPFRIADGLWYVGDQSVCVHLIETAEGLILLDSGFFHTNHLLTESIRRAGFDPADIRWILHTHEHFDHFGAAAEFKALYGTKSAISAVGAAALRKNPGLALMDWSNSAYQEIPTFDYELKDGEIFEFGGVKIRCILTPGHALGVMSYFFEVVEGGETQLVGLFGGAGTGAMTIEYMMSVGLPLDMPQRMLASLDRLEREPVTIHLGNHPGNNQTLEKRERQLKEGGNPFVGTDSWKDFLTGMRDITVKIIAENEEKLKLTKRWK
jgi:metallo-beta-lactamase class B